MVITVLIVLAVIFGLYRFFGSTRDYVKWALNEEGTWGEVFTEGVRSDFRYALPTKLFIRLFICSRKGHDEDDYLSFCLKCSKELV